MSCDATIYTIHGWKCLNSLIRSLVSNTIVYSMMFMVVIYENAIGMKINGYKRTYLV